MNTAVVRNKPKQSAVKQSASRAPKRVPEHQSIINAHLHETIDPERRRAMVAEAAYFFAEHRGFESGHELEDWLAAEDQIDAALRLADLEAGALLNQEASERARG